MDPEQGPSKPTFRRRKWTTAYDTYSDGFTFREELNFEYDSDSSSSDSEPEGDSAVIDLTSDDGGQEKRKRDKRRRNVEKRKDGRWKNIVRNFKNLRKWRIRSMDSIFLHAFDSWQENGFNSELPGIKTTRLVLPSSSSHSRQTQNANIEVEEVSDITVVVENELSRNSEAALNFLPLPQEFLALNETLQRDPDFTVQTLPPIQEFFAGRASIPIPPLAPLSPFAQSISTSEIAAVPPPSTQTRSSVGASRFAVDLPSMTPDLYTQRTYSSVPQPSPFLQNIRVPESSATPVAPVPYGIPPPMVPESSAAPVPYGIPPPIVPTIPPRIAEQPQPLMLNNLPPTSYETSPQSSVQQNGFSASQGYEDLRFVNGIPLPLSLPPPLIPITPELYPICNRIAQRQREQRRFQLQNIRQV